MENGLGVDDDMTGTRQRRQDSHDRRNDASKDRGEWKEERGEQDECGYCGLRGYDRAARKLTTEYGQFGSRRVVFCYSLTSAKSDLLQQPATTRPPPTIRTTAVCLSCHSFEPEG